MADIKNIAPVAPTRAIDVLINKGIITPEQMNIAIAQQRRMLSAGDRTTIDDIIVINGFATRNQLAAAIVEVESSSTGIDSKDNEESISSLLRMALPYALCRRLGIRPLKRAGKKLVVAATRPLSSLEKSELINAAKGANIDVEEIFIAPRDKKETLAAIRTESQVDSETLARKIDRLNNTPDEGALVQEVIHDLMIDATQSRASDIHLDNIEDSLNCWVSFRIDGDLRYTYLLSPDAAKRIATRLKNDAGMDFSDSRRPQDGRFPFSFEGRKIDVRVAAIPIDGGETLTMRLLDPAGLLSMQELFQDSPAVLKRLRGITHIKNKTGGMLIVSGPTGSGKTTTLYAIIRQIDRHRLNVMTVEDPIEYRIPLVRQTQINAGIGADFAHLLRAQLRHDPDILVIGEMRDAITAETALRSTESGHFVLTTLHSADALQTIERLMGLFPADYKSSGVYILSHYLSGVLNQRLAKRVCQSCAKEATVDAAESALGSDLSIFNMSPSEKVKLVNPDGCGACNYTGYLGRILLPEILFLATEPELRHKIAISLMEGLINDIRNYEGVTLEPRLQYAAQFLKQGIIDPDTALSSIDARI